MKRRTVISLLLGFSLTLALLPGCAAGAAEASLKPVESLAAQGEAGTPNPEAGTGGETPSPAESPGPRDSALDMALLRGEYGRKGGNVILSPLSIRAALAMAAQGAAGEAEEALKALGLNGCQMARPAQEEGEDPLSMANSMWFNEKLDGKIDQSFKDVLSSEYGAEEGFFTPGSSASVNEINGWVKENTREKIDSIVTEDALPEDALAILVNALYFDGRWAEPFENQARPGNFYTPHGIQQAQLMADRVKTYFAHGGFTGFSKAYQGGYEFIGILPQELGLELEALDINAFLASETGEYDVDIKIPKFELRYDNSLKETLTQLGLGSLFEDGAMNAALTPEALALGDFAQVDDVLHKTYMRMYEAGTEAAAVTSVGFTYATTAVVKPRERKQVFLDRPFAFLIREAESGRIVFCGAVDSME